MLTTPAARIDDYDRLDAVAMAALVRKGDVEPIELVDAAIARIEALNPALNAVIDLWADEARAAALLVPRDAPLAGVPFLVKDLLGAVGGKPHRYGSRYLETVVAPEDSELIKRYRRAGVVILGKTNTSEYGLMAVTEPKLFGPTRNPWNLAVTPGGSSGGSAAAVAARFVPAAHGNDGGGSIRIPAACTGLFGLKPSRGRNPLGPVLGQAWQGLVAEHVLTRSVRDSATFLDATAGQDPGAPYAAPWARGGFLPAFGDPPRKLKIALLTRSPSGIPPHGEALAAAEAGAALCRSLGHEVEEAAPDIDGRAFLRAYRTVAETEIGAELRRLSRALGRKPKLRDLEPATAIMAMVGIRHSGPALSDAIQTMQQAGRALGAFFGDWDLILCPTLGMPPPPIGALSPTRWELAEIEAVRRLHLGFLLGLADFLGPAADRIWHFLDFNILANATGVPAMSVPLHWTADGLPLGTQFIAPYGGEALLFRLAGQLEAAQPWADRRPPGY
jgi:amidase